MASRVGGTDNVPAVDGGRLATFVGPGSIVEAVRAALDPAVDLVLVRELVPPRATDAVLERPDLAADALAEAIPLLAEADRLTRRWWAEHGYLDYSPAPGGVAGTALQVGMLREGGVSVHLDEDEFGDDPEQPVVIYGPWAMSLALNRPGTFLAERVEECWFTDDRTYDGSGLTSILADDERHLGRPPLRALRTTAGQQAGDAVLIPGHPTPSFHGVSGAEDRRAMLFECCLLRHGAAPVASPAG